MMTTQEARKEFQNVLAAMGRLADAAGIGRREILLVLLELTPKPGLEIHPQHPQRPTLLRGRRRRGI